MEINTTNESLHPASEIFLQRMLGEISSENKSLKEDVASLQPLVNHMQKVEVIAAVSGGMIPTMFEGGGNFSIEPVEKKIVSTAKLSDGKIYESTYVLPITSSQELPLESLCGFFGGIEVRVRGKAIGRFPSAFNNRLVNSNATVDINDDDTAVLFLIISDHAQIMGDLKGLSNEDIVRFREDPPSGGIVGCRRLHNYTTFNPTGIVMDLTAMLRKTLQTIGKVLSVDDSSETKDELRHLTISALGDKDNAKMLKDNNKLKVQHEALMKMREMLIRGDISHGDGVMSFSLDEGEVITDDEEGNLAWKINLWGKEHSSVAVSDITSSIISLSGAPLNVDPRLTNQFYVMRTDDDPYHGLLLPYLNGVFVLGSFNWSALSDEEMTDIRDDFRAKLQSSMSGGRLVRGDVPIPTLPPTFKLNLAEVRFSPGSIKDVMKLVGLDNGLFSVLC